MTRDIAIAFAAIAAFALIFWLIGHWSDATKEKRLHDEFEARKAKRKAEYDERSQPIPWHDDGLDVSKLHVKHEAGE